MHGYVRYWYYYLSEFSSEIYIFKNPTGGINELCECCVLSGRGLCDELISRPEQSYRVRGVVVGSRNLVNEENLVHLGWGGSCCAKRKN